MNTAGNNFAEHFKLKTRFYPEVAISGFSHTDSNVAFWSQVAALLKPTDRVLDFGAGRGEPILDEKVPYRRWLSSLKGRCAHLEGVDVDPVVLENPCLDHAERIRIGEPLPFADDTFDLIVSRSVFEHVDTPEQTASELMRVLKPGGWLCATTPNIWGYISVFARMVPNKLHVGVLNHVQPGRKAEDIFPTRYKMNSKRALLRLFGDKADVHLFRTSGEPAYHFGRPSIFFLFKVLHKLIPSTNHTLLCIFVHKR